MKVKSLTLQNFRGVRELTIDDFHEKVNVFIGENGAGKTTVLEALAKMFGFYTGFLLSTAADDKPSPYDFFTDDDINNNSLHFGSFISCELDKENTLTWGTTGTYQRSWISGVSRVGVDTYLRNTKGFQDRARSVIRNGTEVKILHDITRLMLFTNKIYKELAGDLEKGYFFPVYYRGNHGLKNINIADIQGLTYSRSTAMDGYFRQKWDDRLTFFHWIRMEEDIENEKFREDEPNFLLPHLNHVKGALLSFIDGNYFSSLIVKRSLNQIILRKGQEEYHLSQLSEGELLMLYLCGDLAWRLTLANPGAKDPIREGHAVCFIDEVELHLHPKWQKEILPRLSSTFPNVQFFVTTHSPLVLSHLKPQDGNVYLLKNTEDGIKAERMEQTWGKDVASLLATAMGVTESPEEVQRAIESIQQLLFQNKLDEAKRELDALKEKVEYSRLITDLEVEYEVRRNIQDEIHSEKRRSKLA